jgi:hypothetical protein
MLCPRTRVNSIQEVALKLQLPYVALQRFELTLELCALWRRRGVVAVLHGCGSRGMQNVATEMSLNVLAYNFKRVLSILGFERTRKAMQLLGA